MNTPLSLERIVTAWMADEALDGAVDVLSDRIIDATAGKRPRPRWLALLRETPMTAQTRIVVGSPTRRLALVALLLISAAVGALVIAGALLLRPQPTADVWQGFRGGSGHDGSAVSGPIGSPIARWTFAASASVRTNISISSGIVVVPTEDGALLGLGLVDGKQRWEFRPGTSLTGPAVDGTTVFTTDGAGIVHALDVTTGNPKWLSTLALTGASAPSIGDGKVFIGTADGRIAAFDAADGEQLWAEPIAPADQPLGNPAYADGFVYGASSIGGLVALEASTGKTAWRHDLHGEPVGTIVVAGGVVYAGAQSDVANGLLRAFDARTGDLRWQVDEDLYSPSVTGSLAISGSSSGVVSARDVATGDEVWRFTTRGTNRAPVIAGGIAFVAADAERRVYALDAATGGLLWTFAVDGENQCCLAIAGGMVIAGTMEGTVYAIGGDGVPVTAHLTPEPSVATPTPAASSSPSLPDPFTVVRRFTRADLGLDRPLQLAVAPSGDIYVTDLADEVVRFDRNGRELGRWGKTGSKPGEFDFNPATAGANPGASITVGPGGLVYVSDSDNHRIQVFEPDGTFVRAFGSQGAGSGQFVAPFDLTADADGNVYVFDDGGQTLVKYSPTGDVVWTLPLDGSRDPRVVGHGHTPTIDPQGRIVFSLDDTGRVVYVSPEGEPVDTFDAQACEARVDLAGNVVVADLACAGIGHLRVFDPEHHEIGASDRIVVFAPVFGPDGQAVGLGADGSITIFTMDLTRT